MYNYKCFAFFYSYDFLFNIISEKQQRTALKNNMLFKLCVIYDQTSILKETLQIIFYVT